MKSLNMKLALTAVAIAMLATPALAQRQQHQQQQAQYQTAPGDVGTYPNGAPKTGSAESQQDGADFNLSR